VSVSCCIMPPPLFQTFSVPFLLRTVHESVIHHCFGGFAHPLSSYECNSESPRPLLPMQTMLLSGQQPIH
jgi:hypothetical protein